MPSDYIKSDPRWSCVIEEARSEPFSEVIKVFVQSVQSPNIADSILASIYADEIDRRWALVAKKEEAPDAE